METLKQGEIQSNPLKRSPLLDDRFSKTTSAESAQGKSHTMVTV